MIKIDGNHLNIEDVIKVARFKEKVFIDSNTIKRVNLEVTILNSHDMVKELLKSTLILT